MLMSVFRQQQPREERDHLQCITESVGTDAAHMILHARLHDATVLVGMQAGESIIKPAQPGDDDLRFETLFDSAITLAEWRRMATQKVKDRDSLAPRLWELRLVLEQVSPVYIHLQVKARDAHDTRELVKRLVREDTDFSTALMQRFVAALMAEDGEGSIATTGPLIVDDAASADAPVWQFLDD